MKIKPILRMLLPALATAAGMFIHTSPLSALEGGEVSDSRNWKGITASTTADPAERAAEVEARKKDIDRDIARLKARLAKAPDAATTAKIIDRMKQIDKTYGWVPELKMVWGTRDIKAIINQEEKVSPNLHKALVQLKKDFAARGIDFIYMPYPPTPFYQGHLVVDGVGPDVDIYPGWTKMMLELMENDIEVIDVLDKYRTEAENPIVINWPNDFHTASLGRQIAAKALAERLTRYNFIRSLPPKADAWTETVVDAKNAGWPQRITMVNGMFEKGKKGEPVVLKPGVDPDIETQLKNRTFKYIDLKRNFSKADFASRARLELVLIGDSQLHSAVHGAGLPEFIMRESGGIYRWGSKSWSGFSPPEIYREVVPDSAPQPRVVVLSSLAKYFWDGEKYGPRPLPPLKTGPEVAAAAPEQTFTAKVKITGVSQQKDPAKLDYREALMAAVVEVQDGPMKGKTVVIRYWSMANGSLIASAGKVKAGDLLELELTPWMQAIKKDVPLSRHQIFDDTEQDLETPIFWITKGSLSPESLLKPKVKSRSP